METDPATLKQASVRGVAISFGSQGVRCILQFGAQVALAHFLAPAQFGLVAMVTPVLSLVQVFSDLGLAQATIQRSDISHDELSALFWPPNIRPAAWYCWRCPRDGAYCRSCDR